MGRLVIKYCKEANDTLKKLRLQWEPAEAASEADSDPDLDSAMGSNTTKAKGA